MFDNIVQIYQAFEAQGVDAPLLETLRLCDILPGGAVKQIDRDLFGQEQVNLIEVAARRSEGVPLEYALGRAVFMGLDFRCSQDALIPREETELLVRVALDLIAEQKKEGKERLTIVDIGSGCGNIAISLALNADNVKVLASDTSSAAVELARVNVQKFGLQDRISLLCGDLFEPLLDIGYEGGIDLVVCNPLYIPTSSLRKLAPEIIDHEPTIALDAGAYGMGIFRRLIADSVTMLKPGGTLVFEIGAGQDKMVTRSLRKNKSYTDIRCFDDDAQIRVISAAKQAEEMS